MGGKIRTLRKNKEDHYSYQKSDSFSPDISNNINHSYDDENQTPWDEEPILDLKNEEPNDHLYIKSDTNKKQIPAAVPQKGMMESFKEKTFKQKSSLSPVPLYPYTAPSLDLLTPPTPPVKDASLSKRALEENAQHLMQVLNEFGVKGRLLGVKPGPVVTLYEFEPAPGMKSSRIISLADDIARSMSALSARVSVVPGRNAMGIELPNESRETVYFREVLSSREYQDHGAQLPLGLGKDIGGHPIIADLTKMPHLLVAGTTGSGKSVGVNAMILSLLYKLSPNECKFIMIDPKMLELSVYDGIPHLLSPVVTPTGSEFELLGNHPHQLQSRIILVHTTTCQWMLCIQAYVHCPHVERHIKRAKPIFTVESQNLA